MIVYGEGDLAGSMDKQDRGLFVADYHDPCRPPAQRQIVLLDYRLADALKTTFAP
jgi:hypothetical protein